MFVFYLSHEELVFLRENERERERERERLSHISGELTDVSQPMQSRVSHELYSPRYTEYHTVCKLIFWTSFGPCSELGCN